MAIFSRLTEQDQAQLLDFAVFLEQRVVAGGEAENGYDEAQVTVEVTEPLPIERPPEEAVIAAIKRLSATYPMLDKSVMLNDVASMMTLHVVQGKSATDVIDTLEEKFLSAYNKYRSG